LHVSSNAIYAEHRVKSFNPALGTVSTGKQSGMFSPFRLLNTRLYSLYHRALAHGLARFITRLKAQCKTYLGNGHEIVVNAVPLHLGPNKVAHATEKSNNGCHLAVPSDQRGNQLAIYSRRLGASVRIWAESAM
jgi:hypothetical protein